MPLVSSALPPLLSTKPARCVLAILALACAHLAPPAWAAGETPGGVEGVVYNSTDGLPLGRVKVSASGAGFAPRETLTDDEGRFAFANLPPGAARLDVSYLGFDPQTAGVTIAAGATATRDFQLIREGAARGPVAPDGDVVKLERFSVVADQAMTAQALAMNEQLHAASITNVLALDELPGQGFENIGDYVRFLPGVSIIDNGESPSQISLGGFPANMSNVSIDGAGVASTGIDDVSRSGGRELSLQDVPMMNIERVEITKVPTPDKPASGLGGSMNLISKGMLGGKNARLDYTFSINLAANDNFSFSGASPQAAIPRLSTPRKQPSFSLRATIPAGKKLAFSAGFSKSWKQLPGDMLNETAQWNLTPNRVDSSGNPLPISLVSGAWSQMSQVISTEEISLGAEMKLGRPSTLTLSFRHREIASEHTTNQMSIYYGSYNNANPPYSSTVPPGGDPARDTASIGATGLFSMGLNSPTNYNLETTTDQFSAHYKYRGPDWRLDAQAACSSALRLRTNRGRGYISGYDALSYADGVGRFNMIGHGINTTDSVLPTETIATKTDGTPISPFDASNYFLNLVRMEEYGRYVTDNYSGRLDVERVFNRYFSVKIGGAFYREERDNQRELPTWRMKSRGMDNPISSSVADDPRFIYHYDLIDESIHTSINGMPVRWISPVKLYRLTQEHPEYFQPYSSTPNEIYSQRAAYSKKMMEDIAAGYVRLDARFFDGRLHMATGARYERTDVVGWSGRTDFSAIYQRDADGNRIPDTVNGGYLTHPSDEHGWRQYQERANRQSKDYDGFYPSLNLNYAITPSLMLRAGYARTIGRPNVNDIVSGLSIPDPDDYSVVGTDDPDNPTRNVYRIGISNPGLEPWTANSFHLSLDSYHLRGGFGSIGVYRKNVTNFFVDISRGATDGDLLAVGVTADDIATMRAQGDIEFTRKENIGDANVSGIEFSYRQDLFFLPSWLQKTQVWVNYTHLKIGGEKAEDFIGFSPEAFSAGLNYIRPRFSLRLSVAYQGETKLRRPPRTTTSSNTASLMPEGTFEYQAPITRWGVTAEYGFSRMLTLYASCSDIFGDDIITYRRGPGTPSYAEKYQRRVVASYVSVGLKGIF